jgi:hypothetical protein
MREAGGGGLAILLELPHDVLLGVLPAGPCPDRRSGHALCRRWAGGGQAAALASPVRTAHAWPMTEPHGAGRRRRSPAQRRPLLVGAAGVGLAMAGGLSVALTAPDGLGRTLGVVVLFLALSAVAPLIALWRQTPTGRSDRDLNPRDS